MAAGVTLVFLAWDALEAVPVSASSGELVASFATVVSAAFTLLPALLVADAAVDDGVSRWRAYGIATAIATVLALPLQSAALALLASFLPGANLTLGERVALFTDTDLHWIMAVVALHVARRHALDAMARMGRLQVERARARRELMEERVRAAQARVDPRFLVDAVRRIGHVHVHDAARAIAALEALIRWLRAAMPRHGAADADIEHSGVELALAARYLELRRDLAEPRAFTFVIEAPAHAPGEALPPMLIVPMLEVVLGDRPASELRGHASIRLARADTTSTLRVSARHFAAAAGDGRGGRDGAQAPAMDVAGVRGYSAHDARDTPEARLSTLQERATALLGDGALLVDRASSTWHELVLEWPSHA